MTIDIAKENIIGRCMLIISANELCDRCCLLSVILLFCLWAGLLHK